MKVHLASPKTAIGQILYGVLCVLSVLILIAMAAAPVVMFVGVYGDPWWEMIYFVYIAMIPLYVELLALLKSLHYLALRTTKVVQPTRRGDVIHILYAILGLQSVWLFTLLFGEAGLFNWYGEEILYYASGVLIMALWLVNLVCALVHKYRARKQQLLAEQEADRREWERMLAE